jgi:site-specific recombinase
MSAGWDLTALVNAADPKATLAERHLWLVRLMEWLRHAPVGTLNVPADASAPEPAPRTPRTPRPLLRLKHLLNQLERHDALRERVQGLMAAFWRDIEVASVVADFGFGARVSFAGELKTRLQARLLPGTPATNELSVLFPMLFEPADALWVQALDDATAARVARLLGPPPGRLRKAWAEALARLVATVQAAGFAPGLRERMDAAALAQRPFHQLGPAAGALFSALEAADAEEALRAGNLLRAVIARCREAAASVMPHLEQHGVSVNIVYDLDQLGGRLDRIDHLLDGLLAPDDASAMAEGRFLMLELLNTLDRTRGFRRLFAEHYSLLARQVAERSAETGEHYITRDRGEYRTMLQRAAGGGAVVAGTVFAKFAIAAIGLSAFWGGFWAGVNYAASFVLIMLLHWTLATKQPAMTAPAMAATLPAGSAASDDEIEGFVDRVVQLIRSQVAGIVGNLLACAPLVLLVQWLCIALFGEPAIGAETAGYVLTSQTLLGWTALFAAFTGVLLFVSSLIAGWAENWFVLHRLDSAIAWNPRIVAVLGAPRAQRWARWWRSHISGLAGNVSLGFLLGLLPALLGFFGLPMEVRHVTLATGQLAAAAAALGTGVLLLPAFWWCVAAIGAIGVLNLGVSFYLAFKVALRSRGVRVKDQGRIRSALWARWRREPLSFFRPPR